MTSTTSRCPRRAERWSSRFTSAGAVLQIAYDLSDPVERARVCEQVRREGTDDDVRFYVDADLLRELFDELALPPPVRQAWADWLRRHPCPA